MGYSMIPQGRLSTEEVLGEYLPPEGPKQRGVIDFEIGPIAQTDTSEGLLYQTWYMIWSFSTGVCTAYPETTGNPIEVLTIVDKVIYLSFTFDQTGRINIAYSTEDSSFLYWYDTAAAAFVTTDLGPEVLTPNIYLDDKRASQSSSSDMLLLYTTSSLSYLGEAYALWMRRQRDRFDFDNPYGILLRNNVPKYYISSVGMTDELRIQIGTLLTDPELPILPDAVPIVPEDPVDPDPSNPDPPVIPVLGYMDLARNAYRTGQIDLRTFTTLPFSSVFGQNINDGAFNKIVYPTGLAMTLRPTVDKMQLSIEDSVQCTEAYLFLCTPQGNVISKLHYTNIPLAEGVFVNLNLTIDKDAILVIATDTGTVRIKKEDISIVVPGVPDIIGSSPWESYFSSPFTTDINKDVSIWASGMEIVSAAGIALRFTIPMVTTPYMFVFLVIQNTSITTSSTGTINQDPGNFTTSPKQIWGNGGTLIGYINMPSETARGNSMHMAPGATYILNCRNNSPYNGVANYLRSQASFIRV